MKAILLRWLFAWSKLFAVTVCLSFSPAGAQDWKLNAVTAGGHVSMLDASTGWLAGGSIVRHTSDGGLTWPVVKYFTTEQITDVWAADDTHVWAVTQSGTILHWDGSDWTTAFSVPNYLYAVWGTSASDVWVVGTAGKVLHWNGSAWTTMTPGTTSNVYAVWGSDANNVWIGGIGGFIRKWNGSSWSAQTASITGYVQGFWGTSASNVWAVSSSGDILKWNGSSWSHQTSGTTQSLFAIGGTSSSNVWAVGSNGTVLHWNGSAWSAQNSGVTTSLGSISAVDATHIWASGGAEIIKSNGTTWSTQATYAIFGSVAAIWGSSSNDILVTSSAFGGTGAKWNGSAWSSHPLGAFNGFSGLWGSAANSIWAGGSGGAIRKWDGSVWSAQTSGTTQNLRGASGANATNLWMVGAGGVIVKGNGTTWTAQTSGTTQQLNAVWGSSATNVWTVGNAGTIRRWNGTSWGSVTSGTTENLNGLWGADANNIWAVGAAGTILKWNGTAWTTDSSGISFDLRGIWGTDASHVWAVGAGDSIRFWNGTIWAAESISVSIPLNAIWGTSPSDVWAGGDAGVIYRKVSESEINVEQPVGTPLLDGGSSSFGNLLVGSSLTKTYTVSNTGSADLTGIAFSKTGSHSADFTIVPQSVTTLPTGNSMTFDVIFTPSLTGTRTATIKVASNDSNENPFDLLVSGTGMTAVGITTHPANKTVNPNAAAAFSVSATGSTPRTYQWQKYNTGTMAWDNVGTNAATFSIPHAQESDEGTFQVIVSNAVSTQTSTPATLSVNNPVVIDTQPIPLAKNIGQIAGFSVVLNASTTPPVTYQWTLNNKAIGGANGPAINLSSVTIAQGGDYRCVIKNIAGSKTSDPARLTIVDGAPKLLVLPQNNATTLLTAVVSGTDAATTYAWKRGTAPGSPVTADATHLISGSKLTIKNLQPGDADTYRCEVTVASGTLITGDTTLVVVTSKPALPPATVTPLVMPDAINGGTYSYSILAQLDAASQIAISSTTTPASYGAKGLPAGLVCSAATGLISGKPAVMLTADKTYAVMLTATNGKGTLTIPATLLLHKLTDGLAGAWTGYIERVAGLNQTQGGRLDLNVTLAGTYTGTVKLGAAAGLGVKGALDTTFPGTTAMSTTTVTRKAPLTNLTITFTLDASTQRLVSTSVSDSNIVPNVGSVTGWRNQWNTTNKADGYLGYHNFGLDVPGPVNATEPQGTGYGSFTITNTTTAAVALSGKLADNISYSTTSFVGPAGEVLIFQATAGGDSIMGNLLMSVGTPPTNADSTIGGLNAVSWRREDTPDNTKTRVYEDGFGLTTPISLTAVGGRFIGPVKPDILFGVTDDGSTHNARLVFSEAELGTATNPAPTPDVTFRLSSLAKANFTVPTPRPISLSITSGTGYFTGRFTLVDPNPLGGVNISRPGDYYGMVVKDGADLRGYGFFLLGKRPVVSGQTVSNTEQLSGQVVLEKFP